jgi:hypothetical protein
MDKDRHVPTNPKMEQNSRQPFGSMYCYNTIVYNIMLNGTGLEAQRKEAQNSHVTLLQGLITHSKHVITFLQIFILQSSLQSRHGIIRLLIFLTEQFTFKVINFEILKKP